MVSSIGMLGLKELHPTTGQKVFVRADLDVKVENGVVAEDFRLKKILPTIQYLLAKKAQTILAGHLGRPHGKPDPKLSLKPVADWLEQQGLSVDFLSQVSQGESLQASPITLLENLRFDIREEENDLGFAKELASLADIYVNEAFAVSYEEHASIIGIPKLLPSYAGLQFEKEVETLSSVFHSAKHPIVFVVAGVKPEKAQMVPKFSEVADQVLLAGKIANMSNWSSLPNVTTPKDNTEDNDIGPQTIKMYLDKLKQAKTVVWAGPLGKYEQDQYSKGTRTIAAYLTNSSEQDLIIIGGGDTISALDKFDLLDQFEKSEKRFVSTGGGAMLQFLLTKTLPGIQALNLPQTPP